MFTPKKLELVGLFLILTSAGWQVIVERPLADGQAGSYRYEANQKLDSIWMLLTDLYTHQYPDRNETTSMTNLDVLIQDWDRIKRTGRPIEWWANWANMITAALFLTGSVAMVAGKAMEVREETKTRSPSTP